jgi:4-oxalomesaconate tautomerase
MMRGGTSRGAFFVASDLPPHVPSRDAFLARALGSPDALQVDGIGGGHPLTSKVAVVAPSEDPDADIDYLFLQVWPDTGRVSADQTCGNILAAVGPFAIDRGLVPAADPQTVVRIRSRNGGGTAVATICTPGGRVTYDGATVISGVSRPAAPVLLAFEGTVGSTTGRLLPTNAALDHVDGIAVTCIDNGMPVVVAAANDLGIDGHETRDVLEGDEALRARVRSLRLGAGRRMGLGDVSERTIPKVTLVAPARHGHGIATRTYSSERWHPSIGVLGGVAVATAAVLPWTTAFALFEPGQDAGTVRLEHPSGFLDVQVSVTMDDAEIDVRSAVVRTARRLFEGEVLG